MIPGTMQIAIPRWYQYCLGVDVPRSLVNFSVNGVPAATNLVFRSINSYPAVALIARSKIIVYNEMFGYVNLFNTDLMRTNTSAMGNVVAWNITNWTFNPPAGGFNVFNNRDLVQILGASDGTFTLIVQNSLNFEALQLLCGRVGPGVSSSRKGTVE